MPKAPIPANESARLTNLRLYNILDTLPEVEFDDITRLAAQICGTPVALISLVDEDRQWFKSRIGLEPVETSRDSSFCAHAILGSDLLVVPDTRLDERFAQNELVTGSPNIRFYAGMPLTTPEGFSIGTLCVIDQTPRALTTEQSVSLQSLSRLVLAQLQLRRHLVLQNEVIQVQKQAEEELEKRVSLRTAELQATNNQLILAKKAAEASSRAKADFLTNMSHELRTPMNGILGTTELLLNSDEISEENKGILAVVQESAQALIVILNDILDLSRIGAGKISIEHQDFDLRQTVQIATEIFRAETRQKGLDLYVQVSESVPPVVKGDSHRLRQVLVKLVGNAVKFTREGEIKIRVDQRLTDSAQPYLYFKISDTGIGIPADRQHTIFERFTQADNSLTRKYGGAGLGLAICAHLIELMNGHIWVDSIDGKGSTFHFTVAETRQ